MQDMLCIDLCLIYSTRALGDLDLKIAIIRVQKSDIVFISIVTLIIHT